MRHLLISPSRAVGSNQLCLLAAAGIACLSGCAENRSETGPEIQLNALSADPQVVISQVYGGGGGTSAPYKSDFIELFNRSNSIVALDDLSLQYASATGTGNFGVSGQIALFPPGATLAPGHYFLVELSGGMTGASLPAADATPTPTINLSAASGKVALVRGTTSLGCNGSSTVCDSTAIARVVDLVGYGSANFFETAPTAALSATTAALRKGSGCADTNNNGANFEVGPPAPRNRTSASSLCAVGDSAPLVSTVTPVDGALDVPVTSDLTITFTEPVNVSNGFVTLTCTSSGQLTTTIAGGPITYAVNPAQPLQSGERCTATVLASNVSDTDMADPPDSMVSDYRWSFTISSGSASAIHDVQGIAHRSPLEGVRVHLREAIVTALRSNGFYMQDPVPDADDRTSEAVFVFTSSGPTVHIGDRVLVSGLVEEYRTGCPSCTPTNSAYYNLTTTEITSPTISILASVQPLPPATLFGAGQGERLPPGVVFENDIVGDIEASPLFDPVQDGLDFLESLEAMRVRLEDVVVVDPTRTFSASSMEIGVLPRQGSLASPRTPRGGLFISETDFNPERLFLSNALQGTFPMANVGDHFADPIVGVVDYTFANYKVLVTETLPNLSSGGIAPEVSPLVATLPTQLTIGSLNVENLDPMDPPAKFVQLAALMVHNLRSPDLLALEEVQDNDGATNSAVVSASNTMSALIAAVSAQGGPTYSYREIDPQDDQDGGEPGGNIRQVLLYRIDRGLNFVDRPGASALTANSVSLSSGAPQLAFSPGRLEPGSSAFSSSRKPLAAEFMFAGKRFFVIANHFNSKGGDQPLSGRSQPPEQSSQLQRNQQATIVAGFVQSLLNADPSAGVVVLGDLNDFSFSAPLERLKSVGLVDLVETLPPEERYTYVYQGNSLDLDHILVSSALGPRSTFDVVHVNAEFAVQASDHDPCLARIEWGNAPTMTLGTSPRPVAPGSTYSLQLAASGSPAPTFVLEQGPPGMVVNATSGLVTWQASSVAGSYPVRVRAENGIGPPAVVSFDLSVVSASAAVPGLKPHVLTLACLLALVIGSLKLRRSKESR